MTRQDGLFVSLPPVPLNGMGVRAVVTLPPGLPRPLPIVSAYFQLHTGTTPILEIAGLFNLFIGRHPHPVNLVAGMNRHGAVRWAHDPPIVLQEGEQIEASYGGMIRTAEPRWPALRFLVRPRPPKHVIMPDVQITWLVEFGSRKAFAYGPESTHALVGHEF